MIMIDEQGCTIVGLPGRHSNQLQGLKVDGLDTARQTVTLDVVEAT